MEFADISPEVLVVVTALLNMVRLLGAELVAGEHRDDVRRLTAAILAKLEATPLPDTISVTAAANGLAETRKLLAPILAQIEKQAAAASLLDQTPASLLPS